MADYAYTQLLVLLLLAVVAGGVKESGLRWEVNESDGRVVRSLSDGSQIVTLDYNQQGQLVQCWATWDGKGGDAVGLLYYAETINSFPTIQAMADLNTISKQPIQIDMKEVKRYCKSYMSETMNGNDSSLVEEIETISTLREGFDGSRWCGLSPSKSKSRTALKREDRCCKKWHECSLQIKPYGFNHMMFNYNGHSVIGCNCTVELEECLRNETTSALAEEILDAQFNQLDTFVKCLVVSREQRLCVEWDPVFHECIKYEWTTYGHLLSLPEYKTDKDKWFAAARQGEEPDEKEEDNSQNFDSGTNKGNAETKAKKGVKLEL